MSSVAYYIPIDQRQADELLHSADASAWAGERLEEVVLNGASIIDDQQWMGMYFTLRQLPQAQVTPELPQAATRDRAAGGGAGQWCWCPPRPSPQ